MAHETNSVKLLDYVIRMLIALDAQVSCVQGDLVMNSHNRLRNLHEFTAVGCLISGTFNLFSHLYKVCLTCVWFMEPNRTLLSMGLCKWLDVKWAWKIGGVGEVQMKDSRLPCHKLTQIATFSSPLNWSLLQAYCHFLYDKLCVC